MAFALAIVGIVFVIAAIRGTTPDLFRLLQADFVGPDNFIYWMVAILILGAIGYSERLRPISYALLGLVITVLFLKNGNTGAPGGGFFSQVLAGLNQTQQATVATAPTVNLPANPTTGNTNGGYISGFPSLSNLLDSWGVPGGPKVTVH